MARGARTCGVETSSGETSANSADVWSVGPAGAVLLTYVANSARVRCPPDRSRPRTPDNCSCGRATRSTPPRRTGARSLRRSWSARAVGEIGRGAAATAGRAPEALPAPARGRVCTGFSSTPWQMAQIRWRETFAPSTCARGDDLGPRRRLRRRAASRPRRRRDSSRQNSHVAAAASPRLVSTDISARRPYVARGLAAHLALFPRVGLPYLNSFWAPVRPGGTVGSACVLNCFPKYFDADVRRSAAATLMFGAALCDGKSAPPRFDVLLYALRCSGFGEQPSLLVVSSS